MKIMTLDQLDKYCDYEAFFAVIDGDNMTADLYSQDQYYEFMGRVIII